MPSFPKLLYENSFLCLLLLFLALDTDKDKYKKLLVPLVLELLLMLVWYTSSLPCVSAYASVVFVDMW